MENSNNYAERNANFIHNFLHKIGGSVADFKVDTTDLNTLPTTTGLYVFYVKFNPDSNDRYPIYVGITRRSFRQRFKEHADDGVIDAVYNNTFPSNYSNMSLHAYLVQLHGFTPKFIESILLEAFDFCLNKDENCDRRQNLNTEGQFEASVSKHNFDITWGNSMKDVADINNAYNMK